MSVEDQVSVKTFTQWTPYISGFWSENSSPKNGGNWRAIGRQFQSLYIIFVCAVNTKLARSVP
jgi:hypothetical protein